MKALLALILLTGCASSSVSNACPPLRPWTNDQQDTMAAEIDMLPPGSLLIPAMEDYAKLRAEIRACGV